MTDKTRPEIQILLDESLSRSKVCKKLDIKNQHLISPFSKVDSMNRIRLNIVNQISVAINLREAQMMLK